MNRMIKIFTVTAAAMILAVSCEEFQPVFTGKYPDPPAYEPVEMESTMTILDLKKLYKEGSPVVVGEDVLVGEPVIIKGQVISSDKSGNMYRSFYIQDETAGIEIKIGKTGLYNDYQLGQWVYVDCSGLTLGGYRGMVNLGFKDPTGEYETSYIDIQELIDSHVFRGEVGTPVEPKVLTEADVTGSQKNNYFGTYVTLKGLEYDSATFTLLYVDPDGDRKNYSQNGIFLDEDGGTWGITTWAMSEEKFGEYYEAGNFDSAQAGSGTGNTVGDHRKGNKGLSDIPYQACSVSQYFTFGNTGIQIRTSGYARFSDSEIDPDILSKKKTIDVTGILTIYKTDLQFTFIDLNGLKVN